MLERAEFGAKKGGETQNKPQREELPTIDEDDVNSELSAMSDEINPDDVPF